MTSTSCSLVPACHIYLRHADTPYTFSSSVVLPKCGSACRCCKYGGDDEYWVDIRETGEKGQEKSKTKERREECEDCVGCVDCFFPSQFALQPPTLILESWTHPVPRGVIIYADVVSKCCRMLMMTSPLVRSTLIASKPWLHVSKQWRVRVQFNLRRCSVEHL